MPFFNCELFIILIPDTLTNIQAENFSANLTTHVQPNDQGIIHCFKAHYQVKFIHHAIDLYENDVTPSAIYEVNQLEAMQLAQHAWNAVNSTTIANCWKHSGILPTSNSGVTTPTATPSTAAGELSSVEKDLEAAIDRLQEQGVIQACNRMALEFLLAHATGAFPLEARA